MTREHLLSPISLGPLTLRNRLIKSATFEGMTPDAVVTDELIEFHREHAAGGVAISTVAKTTHLIMQSLLGSMNARRESPIPGFPERRAPCVWATPRATTMTSRGAQRVRQRGFPTSSGNAWIMLAP